MPTMPSPQVAAAAHTPLWQRPLAAPPEYDEPGGLWQGEPSGSRKGAAVYAQQVSAEGGGDGGAEMVGGGGDGRSTKRNSHPVTGHAVVSTTAACPLTV